MATYNGTVSQNASYYKFYIVATESNVGTAATNKSDVTVKVYLKYSNFGWISGNNYTVSCVIDGTSYSTTYQPNVSAGSYTDVCIGTFTKSNIKHNTDGSKSVSVSASFASSGTYSPGNCSASGTFTLTKITRQYTISYNANGGSGAPTAQTQTYGVAIKIKTTIPTRSGYKFLGWSTSKTATTASYVGGQSFTPNKTTTLYAVWQQLGILHINDNGTWKKGKVWINDNGTWKTGIVFINVNGTWKQGGNG